MSTNNNSSTATEDEGFLDSVKTWFADHPNVRYALEATGLFVLIANALTAKLILMMVGYNPIMHFILSVLIFFAATWTRMYFVTKEEDPEMLPAATS